MVKIDDTLLQRLQKLAMVEIESQKVPQVEEELNRFLEFVEVLDELDLSNVEATFSINVESAPLRKDEPKNDPEVPTTILQHAPKAEENFFIVPKIIE